MYGVTSLIVNSLYQEHRDMPSLSPPCYDTNYSGNEWAAPSSTAGRGDERFANQLQQQTSGPSPPQLQHKSQDEVSLSIEEASLLSSLTTIQDDFKHRRAPVSYFDLL